MQCQVCFQLECAPSRKFGKLEIFEHVQKHWRQLKVQNLAINGNPDFKLILRKCFPAANFDGDHPCARKPVERATSSRERKSEISCNDQEEDCREEWQFECLLGKWIINFIWANHQKGFLRCTICHDNFHVIDPSGRLSLGCRGHVEKHLDQPIYNCRQCTACFATTGRFRYHLNTKHATNSVKRNYEPLSKNQCDAIMAKMKDCYCPMEKRAREKEYVSSTNRVRRRQSFWKQHSTACFAAFHRERRKWLSSSTSNSVKSQQPTPPAARPGGNRLFQTVQRLIAKTKTVYCNLCRKAITAFDRTGQEIVSHAASHLKLAIYGCRYCTSGFTFINSVQLHSRRAHNSSAKYDYIDRIGENETDLLAILSICYDRIEVRVEAMDMSIKVDGHGWKTGRRHRKSRIIKRQKMSGKGTLNRLSNQLDHQNPDIDWSTRKSDAPDREDQMDDLDMEWQITETPINNRDMKDRAVIVETVDQIDTSAISAIGEQESNVGKFPISDRISETQNRSDRYNIFPADLAREPLRIDTSDNGDQGPEIDTDANISPSITIGNRSLDFSIGSILDIDFRNEFGISNDYDGVILNHCSENSDQENTASIESILASVIDGDQQCVENGHSLATEADGPICDSTRYETESAPCDLSNRENSIDNGPPVLWPMLSISTDYADQSSDLSSALAMNVQGGPSGLSSAELESVVRSIDNLPTNEQIDALISSGSLADVGESCPVLSIDPPTDAMDNASPPELGSSSSQTCGANADKSTVVLFHDYDSGASSNAGSDFSENDERLDFEYKCQSCSFVSQHEQEIKSHVLLFHFFDKFSV